MPLHFFTFTVLFRTIYQFCTCIYLLACIFTYEYCLCVGKIFRSFANYCESAVETL